MQTIYLITTDKKGNSKTSTHADFKSANLEAQKDAMLGFGFHEMRDEAGKLISTQW
jgi:hypothetical protein